MNPFEESINAAGNGIPLVGWIVLVLSIICIFLIIRILVQDPKRTTRPFGKLILLLIFFVLSPMIYLLNFAVAVEDSKKVEFCNSCHIMHGYVNSTKDPDSEYLSSLHYPYLILGS